MPRRAASIVGSLIVTTLALLGGCGPSLEDVVAPHADEARAQLEKLETVLDHCRALEPIEEDAPPKVEGVVFADSHERPHGNARVIWLDAYDGKEDYAEPIESGYTRDANWWHQTAAALSSEPPAFTDGELERLGEQFEYLNETEYVLIVKTREYEAPKVTEEPPFESEDPFYNLGAMAGEAHLYRLRDGEHLGAVQFAAYGQQIGVGMLDLGITSDDPAANITSLKQRLFGDIHDFAQATLAKRAEGVDSVFELEETGPWLADKVSRRSWDGDDQSDE